MPDKLLLNNSDVDEKFQTLVSNASAARIISQTLEGTIGPKGLDIMMVGNFGDVVVSNDGVTILKLMEVKHPAARMIINAARAQQEEVGDGTTTATIIAGTLVAEGVNQVLKGVPVTQVIQGIQTGIDKSIELIEKQSYPLDVKDHEMMYNVACIAGRGQKDLARLVMEGVEILGREKLLEREYKYSDAVIAREGVESKAFAGTIVNKKPLNMEFPAAIDDCRILVIDDALAPEEISTEARGTEAGFRYYLDSKEEYERNLQKVCDMGVNIVLIDRNIDDIGEQILVEAGVMVIQRLSHREIEKVCRHTGARKIKRSGLNRSTEQLESCLGKAARIEFDDRLSHTCIFGGTGEPLVTLLIGAATEEVVDERERIARDAASAIQAAVQKGIVPGGGAIEVWVAKQLEQLSGELKGMTSYGALCVKEALLKPFTCIALNSGFNPLEKLGDVIAEQKKRDCDCISIDCDSGDLIDTFEHGIIDPALVKIHAIKAGGEVAMAILRINTIIKMNDGETHRMDIGE